MSHTPFKWETKSESYRPKGMPKVRMPKVKVREPKMPRVDRFLKLKLK